MIILCNSRNRFPTVTIVLFLACFIIVGCNNQTTTQNNENNIYLKEYQDLHNKINEPTDVAKQTDYSIRVNIDIKDNQNKKYITYKTQLTDPLISMEDVKISFILQPSMLIRLRTPSVFYTSINDKRNVLLDPIKIKQFDVSLAIPLSDALIDQSFVNDYKKVLTKITWKSANGNHHLDYQMVEGQASAELNKFLDENMN